jgi:hypothetical protein
MPCNSEYMKPTEREIESQLVAGHLLYLLTALNQESRITDEMREAVESCYGAQGKVDEWTALLCGTIRQMTTDEQDEFVYEGKNPSVRRLAEWWERHQAWDVKREAQELLEKERKESENLIQKFKQLPLDEQQRLLALVKTRQS